MITLKEFMEVISYQITEGSQYCWTCYGTDAYSLDSWNGDQNGHVVTIVFDKKTQEVYEVAVCDYKNDRAYRMGNPLYEKLYTEEAARRGVAASEAWEDVNYTNLDVLSDFIEKTTAIIAGKDYDPRVQVALDIVDGELFALMKLAHEADVSLNVYITTMLESVVEKLKKEKDNA
jgi:hypothetical protein